MKIIRALAALCLALFSQAAIAQSGRVGGAIPFHLTAANSTNSTLISTGNRIVYSVELGGIGSSPAYVKFYDKASAPICGTDTPIKTLLIPAASTAANGAGSNVLLPIGFQVQNGLGICITGGIADSDATSVAASSFIVNVDYR